jgi:hypothetical protein
MTEAWTVIVFGHGPDLIRSRDAAVRAVPDGRVIAVERSADFIANLARTVAVARGESVLMIEAGYELLAEGVRGLASALVIGSSAVAGSISVESRDGVHSARWQAGGASASEVLGDPRAVSPIWASSRELMASVTFDADLPGLEIVDAWLQLIERSGRDATILPELVGRIDASRPSRWHALAASATYPGVFRRLLAKYHRYVDADMTGLLLDREVGFGRLRDRHLELLQRRDQALLELDRLRAETAHHRAFLAHHGLDRLDWGSLDRVVPISRDWGYERGGPVDRR